MVIDGLGGPGDPDESNVWAPLSTRAVADARASGITACNVTVAVGGDPWEDTVRSIAWQERELDVHPDVFLKVTHAAHLREANAHGRWASSTVSRGCR
jgi:membrane dipeptidase